MGLIELLEENLPDGPTTVLLSGGLDSVLLATLLRRAGRLSVAFSADDDEFPTAAAVCAAQDIRRHVRVPVDRLADDFEAAVRACGKPIINGRAIVSYRLFRAVHDAGEDQVVSGVGADEFFRGHIDDNAAWLATLAEDAEIIGELTGEDWYEPTAATVFRDLTLPPVWRVALAFDLKLCMPYLRLREFAEKCDLTPRDGLGKWPIREAAAGLVPDAIRLAPKVARLRPPDDFAAVYARWIPGVDPGLPERIRLALASRAVLSSPPP
jgi:asparagine synthetase B (glutamine-hydrolysing)